MVVGVTTGWRAVRAGIADAAAAIRTLGHPMTDRPAAMIAAVDLIDGEDGAATREVTSDAPFTVRIGTGSGWSEDTEKTDGGDKS